MTKLEKIKIFSFAIAKPSIFLFIFYYVTLYIFMNKETVKTRVRWLRFNYR